MSNGPSSRTVARIVLVAVGVLVGVYLVYLLRKPLTWIVIAGFIAIAVSGPIRWLDQRIHRRGLAVAVVYLAVILTPAMVAAILVPPIVKEANNLVDSVPTYVSDLQRFVHDNKQLSKIEADYDITGQLQAQAAKLPAKIGGAAGVLGSIGLGIVNSLFAGVTILILSIFLVGSGSGWINSFINRRPLEQQPMLRRATQHISAAVGGYVAGALLQATIAGITSFILLSILGVPYAAALALIVALLDLVPLVGATLGAIVVGIVTVFTDFPVATIIWVIWSIIYQQVENTVIQPRIQARAVQVHPFVVLVAVLFGSTLFGVLGALLAIPFAAAIQIIGREYRRYREAVRAGLLTATPSSPVDIEPPPAPA
jgi:predicted PurR-regulated permease PerM